MLALRPMKSPTAASSRHQGNLGLSTALPDVGHASFQAPLSAGELIFGIRGQGNAISRMQKFAYAVTLRPLLWINWASPFVHGKLVMLDARILHTVCLVSGVSFLVTCTFGTAWYKTRSANELLQHPGACLLSPVAPDARMPDDTSEAQYCSSSMTNHFTLHVEVLGVPRKACTDPEVMFHVENCKNVHSSMRLGGLATFDGRDASHGYHRSPEACPRSTFKMFDLLTVTHCGSADGGAVFRQLPFPHCRLRHPSLAPENVGIYPGIAIPASISCLCLGGLIFLGLVPGARFRETVT